jgi:hypothetical protein
LILVITQCLEVLKPLTDRRKINVIDESGANVLNTSATCGYAHQNDKAVVATFIFGFASGAGESTRLLACLSLGNALG